MRDLTGLVFQRLVKILAGRDSAASLARTGNGEVQNVGKLCNRNRSSGTLTGSFLQGVITKLKKSEPKPLLLCLAMKGQIDIQIVCFDREVR